MVTTLSTGGGASGEGGALARLFVAGPNLAIDRTAALPVLRPGDVLRTREVAVTPGGKGVNVVRAARALGVEAGLAGFLPGRMGAVAGAMLGEEGTRLRGIPTGGELRSTSVLREDDGRVTVLNEPGPPVTAQDWARLEHAVGEELKAGAAVLVCSGSVPPGAPADGFARLVALARAAAVPVLVDAKGPLLRAALAAGPDVVTPNLAEAEGLLGGDDREGVDVEPGEARARAEAACRGLQAAGAGVAVVTAAAAGAAVAATGGVWWFAAPAVTVANPIGAGDAFAAGYAVALARGRDAVAATRAAVATASAAVEHPLAGALDPARAAELERALRPAP